MVIVDEDERTITESLGGEGINDGYDTAVVYMLPLLDTPDCSGVA
jgi:hypothetical protein